MEAWLRRLTLRNELDVLTQRAKQVRYLASGFDDNGSELLALVRWSLGLGDRARSRRWPVSRKPPPRVNPEQLQPKLDGRIPASYRWGWLSLLSGLVLAAIAGPAVVLSGMGYLVYLIF